MRLYAISYDDAEVLAEFSEKQSIPYPLLSDIDSAVIRRFGILNDSIEPGDALLYGIPYPGTYVCDEDGVGVAKFFHDSYKKRDSAEVLVDAALGRVVIDEAAPQASGGDESIRITAAVRQARKAMSRRRGASMPCVSRSPTRGCSSAATSRSTRTG